MYGGIVQELIEQQETFTEISSRLIGWGYIEHCKLCN